MDFSNQFIVSVAYKLLASQLMVAEVNHFSTRLELEEDLRFGLTNAVVSVNPPLRAGLGHVATPFYQYSFPGDGVIKNYTNENGIVVDFPERGKLAYVSKKNPFAKYGDSLEERMNALSKLKSSIDTNGAYAVATQWLSAVSVDVAALERRYKVSSTQEFLYDPPLTFDQFQKSVAIGKAPPDDHKKIFLPIFDVTWGGTPDDTPPVWIKLFGTTKALIHLRMENTTFLRRPAIAITNALELNTRPNPPEKKLIKTNMVSPK